MQRLYSCGSASQSLCTKGGQYVPIKADGGGFFVTAGGPEADDAHRVFACKVYHRQARQHAGNIRQ